MELVYLAAPYSDKDSDIMEHRLAMFCLVDAKLAMTGVHTVSPMFKAILFNYTDNVPKDWEFWKNHGSLLMSKCDKLIVVKLDGWDVSEGVLGEMELAKENGIPIEYLDYSEFLFG